MAFPRIRSDPFAENKWGLSPFIPHLFPGNASAKNTKFDKNAGYAYFLY